MPGAKMSHTEFIAHCRNKMMGILQVMLRSKLKMNINFISVNDWPLDNIPRSSDYLLMRFKNGEMMVFPRNMNGIDLRKHLGLRRFGVTHWAPLPSSHSQRSPFLQITNAIRGNQHANIEESVTTVSIYDTFDRFKDDDHS